jgi:hypothetical protein
MERTSRNEAEYYYKNTDRDLRPEPVPQHRRTTCAARPAPPVRFGAAARSYERRGLELINLTSARRARMAEYSAHFERLNARAEAQMADNLAFIGSAIKR